MAPYISLEGQEKSSETSVRSAADTGIRNSYYSHFRGAKTFVSRLQSLSFPVICLPFHRRCEFRTAFKAPATWPHSETTEPSPNPRPILNTTVVLKFHIRLCLSNSLSFMWIYIYIYICCNAASTNTKIYAI